jgi:formate hydrogenlyase subunit 6/NADH:ubiquinone oxidoreductase subunit I
MCIGCRICIRDCPSNAITITKTGDKRFECVIDLSKCVYCAQCVDSCPKKALHATREFELASLDVKKLKATYGDKPQAKPEEGAAK